MQTLSEENYLKAIYHLGKAAGKKVSITGIAEVLRNNPASVTDMLKKLVDKGLIQYDKSKGAKLTDKGRKAALLIVRKHRLWEVFLLEKLGYAWDEVHDIAEQLEHVQHKDLADRLEHFLGFPKYDPHGDPIPGQNGELPSAPSTTLEQVSVGKACQVVGVKDTSAPFLQYLKQLDLGIGTDIKVLEKVTFDGTVVIGINKDKQATVSKKLAENVLVKAL